MKATPIETYYMFLSLKMHFTTKSYNFFKYNGKLKKVTDLHLRKDKYQFVKLSKIVNLSEMRDYLIANFVAERKWVGEFLAPEAMDTFLKYKKYNEAMAYCFQEDLEKINLKEDFKIVDGQNPKILELVYSEEIDIRTFIYLNEHAKFFDKFTKQLDDDLLWPKLRLTCEKLLPFIHYKNSLKNILKKELTSII